MKDEEVPGCFAMLVQVLSVIYLLGVIVGIIYFMVANVESINNALHLQSCSFERLQIVCPPTAGNK